MEETTVKERIMQFIAHKKITVNLFERKANLSVGYMRQLRKEPSLSKIKSIITAFPDLNEQWLLTGSGDMILNHGNMELDEDSDTTTEGNGFEDDTDERTISQRVKKVLKHYGVSENSLALKTNLSQTTINSALKNNKDNISSKILNGIYETFPEIDPGWLLTGEGEMLKSPEVRAERAVISFSKGVPFYNESFECGFNDLEPSSVANPDFLVQMPGYAAASLWCRATGASMEPEISSGDLIALQRVNNLSNIIFGEIYAIVTSNGLRTVKRVRKSDAKGCIRLVPANPEYDEQDIPVECITFIYRVLGALKSF